MRRMDNKGDPFRDRQSRICFCANSAAEVAARSAEELVGNKKTENVMVINI